MKIIFFNPTLNTGGVGRVISTWSNYFVRNNINVEIVLDYRDSDEFGLLKNIKFRFLKKNNSRLAKILYGLNLFVILIKFYDDKSILIFNKFLYTKFLILSRISKKSKYVYFIHGSNRDFIEFYNLRKIILLLLTYDYFIALHEQEIITKNYIQKLKYILYINFIRKKLVFIPNPLPYKVNEYVKKQLKNNFVAVGRLEDVKGFDLLLLAWKEFTNHEKDWKLTIVGDGNKKADLLELTRKLNIEGSVTFIGKSADVNKYYEDSDVLVAPSRKEGMGLAILEALSYGLPVLTFKTDGAMYLVRDGWNGYLVDDFSPEKMSDRMLYIVRNPQQISILGENACERSKSFEIERISEMWMLFFKIIQKK